MGDYKNVAPAPDAILSAEFQRVHYAFIFLTVAGNKSGFYIVQI